MTAPRDASDALADMLDAIEKIELFTAGMTQAQFTQDDKTVFAVVRAFEILGEASKLVPADVRARHDTFPWREMARMRDKLIHAYFGVDTAVLWATIEQDVPSTKAALKIILAHERTPQP